MHEVGAENPMPATLQSIANAPRVVQTEAPREPWVGPLAVAWHINADRSIWALHQVWRAGIANKEALDSSCQGPTACYRPGRRLNGTAPPLKVGIPGNP